MAKVLEAQTDILKGIKIGGSSTFTGYLDNSGKNNFFSKIDLQLPFNQKINFNLIFETFKDAKDKTLGIDIIVYNDKKEIVRKHMNENDNLEFSLKSNNINVECQIISENTNCGFNAILKYSM